MADCLLELRDKVNELLGEKATTQLYKFISNRAEARLKRGIETDRTTAYYKVTHEYIKDMETAEERAELALKNTLLAKRKEYEQVYSFAKKGKGLTAQGYGIESNLPNARRSLVADFTNNQNRYLKLLVTYLEEAGDVKLREYFLDNRNELNLVKESFGEDTGDLMAKKAVAAYKKMLQVRRKEAADCGVIIDEDENYIAHTSHNSDSIKSATGSLLGDARLKTQLFFKYAKNYEKAKAEYKEIAYQRWEKEFKKRFANDETLKNVDPDKEGEFFRSFHEAVTNPLGIHKAPYDMQTQDLKGAYYGLAGRLSQKKLAIPNSAEDWMAYNKMYGYGSFRGAVQRGALRAGRDVTVMRRLGAIPRATVKFLIDHVSEDARSEDGIGKAIKRYNNLINEMLGDEDNVGMSLPARIIRSNIMFQYAVKTGGIFLTEMNDLGIGAFALKELGVSSVKFYQTYFKYLFKGMPEGEQKYILMNVNAYTKGNLGGFLADYGAIDSPMGSWYKFSQLNEKLSMVNRHDGAVKAAAGELISRRVADSLGGKWDNLPKELRRTYEVAGIDEKFFNLLKMNSKEAKLWGNTKMVTPDLIDSISDASIKDHFGDIDNMARFRDELKDRLGAYITDQIGYVKILPTIGDRALSHLGVDKNSTWGQIINSLLMFKNFHIASFRRTAMRFLYSNGAQNLPEALLSGTSWSKYLKYAAYTLPFGYVSYAAHLLANGENLPDLDNMATWENTLVRSNAVFLMGSMLADVYNSQHGVVDSLMGPAVKTVEDVGSLLKTVVQGKDPSKQLFWLIENNMPMIHLWYAKALIQHMFTNDILENIDPMSGSKRIRHAAEHGQSYWWSPTDNAGIF